MKILVFLMCLLFCFHSFGFEGEEKVKPSKMSVDDFKVLVSDDTGSVVIDLFFKKREEALLYHMPLFPMSAALAAVPKTRFFGLGSAIITAPLFANGVFMLSKYRKRKLYNVLTEYMQTGHLPTWIRKKANKMLTNYEELPVNY